MEFLSRHEPQIPHIPGDTGGDTVSLVRFFTLFFVLVYALGPWRNYTVAWGQLNGATRRLELCRVPAFRAAAFFNSLKQRRT